MKKKEYRRYNCLSEVWPMIEKMDLDGKKIAIFGYSRLHVLFSEELKKNKKIESLIFIDNGASFRVKYPSEHQVFKPHVLNTKYKDYFVLILSYHAKAMKEQLDVMGLEQDKQYVVLKDLSIWQKKMKKEFKHEYRDKKIIEKEEYRNILLGMLCEIQTVCREYGLKYYLDGGTILGAVRHKGFIPWDHDCDLMMPYKDAMKLGEIMEKRNEYDFMYITNTKTYPWIHPRITRRHTRALYHGMYNHLFYETPIYIDLDIFNGYGNDCITADKYQSKMRKYWDDFLDCIILDCTEKNDTKVIRKILNMQTKTDYETSTYVGKVYGLAEADYFKREEIEPPEYLEFENKKMPVPKNYKRILEMYYGNYMSLPPFEVREKEDDITFYWDY